MIITLVFEKTPIFCRKLAKIAENCDHNIDPRMKVDLMPLQSCSVASNSHQEQKIVGSNTTKVLHFSVGRTLYLCTLELSCVIVT
jgi:hypothetical protein